MSSGLINDKAMNNNPSNYAPFLTPLAEAQIRVLVQDSAAGFRRLRAIGAIQRKYHADQQALRNSAAQVEAYPSRDTPERRAKLYVIHNEIARAQRVLDGVEAERREIHCWLSPVSSLLTAVLKKLNVRSEVLFPELDPVFDGVAGLAV